MVIGNLVLHLAPDSADGIKKYLKYLFGLIMLITLITPVLNSCQKTEEIQSEIMSFFKQNDDAEQDQSDRIRSAVIEGTVKETAYAVITYIHQQYGIEHEHISVSVITNEEAEPVIEELQIYLYNCSIADREKIRRDIESMTDRPVFVFGKNTG